MANTYILSGTTSRFVTHNHEAQLDPSRKYEAALLSLDMYNSIPNIIEEKNNAFEYSVDNGITWKIITINTGAYELSAINNEIQRKMIAEGDFDGNDSLCYITITANESRGTSIINVTSKNYKVAFNEPHSIGPVLGFNANDLLSHGYNESPNKVDITTINSILVNINIISGSYVKGALSSSLHAFYPSVGFGYKIIEKPTSELIWYPVSTNDISRMELTLTDQDGKLIDIGGERLTVRICVREVQNRKDEIIQAIKYLKSEKIL
jgi:hypothetical protein